MTPLQTLLGVELPIIQAPMAGVQGSALAVAVCNAGGLGSLPCAMLGVEAMRDELAAIRAQTDKPYNVNFFCHAPPIAERRPGSSCGERRSRPTTRLRPRRAGHSRRAGARAVQRRSRRRAERAQACRGELSFRLAIRRVLARVKRWGAKIFASATTVDEARWLEAHGVDAVIAQGVEAGGHRGSFLSDDLRTQIGTFALVPQVVRAVKIPVIAAGGIADAEGVAAALRSARRACRSGRPTCSVPKPRRARCIARR